MSDRGWIPVHKSVSKLLPRDRPYTILEAYVSFRIDLDNGIEWSINGYSKLWQWSRCKVRRFTSELGEIGKTVTRHRLDRDETGTRQEICFYFNGLQNQEDSGETVARQREDSGETLLIKTKTKTNKNTLHPLAEMWNEIVGKPIVTACNKSRMVKIKARLQEQTLESWRQIFQAVTDSPFLRGENDRGWRADFDWIIANDSNYLKVMEGKYSNSSSPQNKSTENQQDAYIAPDKLAAIRKARKKQEYDEPEQQLPL